MSLDDAAVVAGIARFSRWHYEFDLRGHKTPIFDRPHANRHAQRERYFFRPLVELCGGSLRGKRVLDLGCNAGFWSLKAIEAGCDFVLGIDARKMHVEQANFVFQALDVPRSRYEFRQENIFDLLRREQSAFDVVLCLGLFYHVSKHMDLLEGIHWLNRDVLVIDTLLCTQPGSLLEVVHEPLDEPRNACDYELVMVPTRQAVLEMVGQFGYRALVLRPEFTSYEGAHDFQNGSRRAFLCSKRTELAPLNSLGEA